jgi:hypothetical protein
LKLPLVVGLWLSGVDLGLGGVAAGQREGRAAGIETYRARG